MFGSRFERGLEKIKIQIEVAQEMAAASEKMEMLEMFDNAERRGLDYGPGFKDGFFAAWELHRKYDLTDFIHHKYSRFDF
jgi:hypothetical protein